MRSNIIPTTPWADGGVNPVPGSPTTGATYLTTLTTELMAQAAQYGTVANSAVINQLLKTITEYCIELEANGILQWSAGTAYTAASGAVVKGSNGKCYQAIADSVGQDPTTSPTYWATFGGVTRTTNANGTAWTFPGGFIVQAGTALTSSSAQDLPIAFPTACISIVATYKQPAAGTFPSTGGANTGTFAWASSDGTQFTVNFSTGTAGVPIFWIAVGY